MSAFLPEEIAIGEALPALGALAALFFILGCLHVLDAFCRALFGTLTGAVGWIPHAGHILTAPIHKVEQKVSHSLGRAERGIDARIGVAFHKLGHIIRSLARDIEDQAKLVLGVTLLLDQLLTFKHFRKLLRLALGVVWKAVNQHSVVIQRGRDQTHAIQTTVTHRVIPGVKVARSTAAAALGHALPRARARERAQDASIGRIWRWIRHRRTALTTGAFIGAFVWALGKTGLRWLRCSRNKRITKELCGPKGDFLLDLLEGGVLILGTLSIVELAKELQDEMELATSGITGFIRETR